MCGGFILQFMIIDIVEPYGFCVGVSNAITNLFKLALDNTSNITVINQLVHNQKVNEKIKEKGINIISGNKSELIDKVDFGTIVFSAHGTNKKLIEKAKEKGLNVVDLVCPYVLKTFNIINNKLNEGYDVIYIGIKSHEESEAALSISNSIHFVTSVDDVSQLDIDNSKIAIINQTTLSITSIKNIYNKILEKYPNATIIDEICDSTRTRQENATKVANNYDFVIVVGDDNSNNAKSLLKAIKEINNNVVLISDASKLDINLLTNVNKILVCSSASTSKEDVLEIVNNLKRM